MSYSPVLRFFVGISLAAGLACAQAGCSGGSDTTDAGNDVSVPDSGSTDAGKDGATPTDAGDAGDAGDAVSDVTVTDAGSDAPPLTNPTSIQIQAVRNAATQAPADGGTVTLPVDGAVVTYVKSSIGSDPAGFFVQAEQTGPALFVAVDPTALTPVPVPGDQVSFVVTQVVSVTSVKEATAITTFTRTAQNVALAPLL